MNLLFFIGTLGAICFLWLYPSKKRALSLKSNQDAPAGNRLIDFNKPIPDALLPVRRKLSPEEEQWFVDHTDSEFGRPTGFEPPLGWNENAEVFAPNEYFVSFLENVNGTIPVSTDEFPLTEQKRILLWLKANMNSIVEMVPQLLLNTAS